ncbi:hypothetical protein B9Z55_014145 [Caenorhabditis nigoni]|uniref:Uncharacterized protein n=1 Tax=Caenorhabditis nigoni TaxID=1611254 RepID=A0A2G5U4Q3_9PELO|nr:hypothetical protein B9Z55_014145 [Caenorhabditis nigoni]
MTWIFLMRWNEGISKCIPANSKKDALRYEKDLRDVAALEGSNKPPDQYEFSEHVEIWVCVSWTWSAHTGKPWQSASKCLNQNYREETEPKLPLDS